MPELAEYAVHSAYTDPGLLARCSPALPVDLPALTSVVRNVLVHYRGGGFTFEGERLADIDNRWVDRILASDQRRFPQPLARPRPAEHRVAGCCRDFTLLTVAALREHGVPARSRVGFVNYFSDESEASAGFWCDHVIVEAWDGQRWIFADAQLDPAGEWGFDPLDLPRLVGATPSAPPLFATAAQVWTAYRRGDIDPSRYGVDPEIPLGGPWFIRNYVLAELAHRQRDELLLWDIWGDMSITLDGADVALADEVAALLLAADDGDPAAEATLDRRYAADPRLHPQGTVRCLSPTGLTINVDLTSRDATPVPPEEDFRPAELDTLAATPAS